jgi:hypothetical protein
MEVDAKELANERNDWEQQKTLMQKQTFSDSEPISLNVGGKIFFVALVTMTQKLPNTHFHLFEDEALEVYETMFSTMFSGRFDLQRDQNKRVFINRDGTHFRYILNYLRAEGDLTRCCFPWKFELTIEELIIEAEYYSLTALKEVLEKKIKDIGSCKSILNRKEKDQLSTWMNKNPVFTLLYKGTRDGFGANDFHRLCNNKGATLTIIKSENGSMFGGYLGSPWRSAISYLNDPSAFLFSSRNPYETGPILIKNVSGGANVVYDSPNYGPTFGGSGGGHDLFVCNNCDQGGSTLNLGKTYSLPTEVANTAPANQLLCGGASFKVKEIEVFSVA